MADDLFSFLDDNNPPNDVEDDNESDKDEDAHPMVVNEIPLSPNSKKRKLDAAITGDITVEPSNARISDEGDDEMGDKVVKRPRLDEAPNPVVVDEFETEAKREVAASAGLTGAVEAGSRLELKHQVRHQVAVPPGYPYIPISQHVPPAKPAREYKFTLDPFQQVSVHAIQRNESVLVSAHTSAGKTVVAEYAIAQCLENKQRVIYTSPIKVCCAFTGNKPLTY